MEADKKAILNAAVFKGNELAMAIFEVVKKYTFFPGTLVSTQFRKVGKTALTITSEDMPAFAEAVEKALANFVNPIKTQSAKQDLLQLMKNGKG